MTVTYKNGTEMLHNFHMGNNPLAGVTKYIEKNPRELLHGLLFLIIQF